MAALTGGVVTNAVNVPRMAPEDMELPGPFLPLCEQLGRLAVALAAGRSTASRCVPGPARRARLAPADDPVLNGVL